MKVFIQSSVSGLLLETDGRRASAEEEAGTFSKAPRRNGLRDRPTAVPPRRLARMRCAKPVAEEQVREAMQASACGPTIRAKLNEGFVVTVAEIPRMGSIITDPEGKKLLVTGLLAPASSAECDVIICVKPESSAVD